MSRVIVPLAEGFEEIEAVSVVDVLRRAGIEVIAAGVGAEEVKGSHGIAIRCDDLIENCLGMEVDAVVLPGGLPGTSNLAKSAALCELVVSAYRKGKTIAAICAAPTVLSHLGLLKGKKATVHPNHVGELGGCTYIDDGVVRDGRVVTSQGAGTALAFALELVCGLVGEEQAQDIKKRIVY